MKKLLWFLLFGFTSGFVLGIIATAISNINNIWYYWLLIPIGLAVLGLLISWTIYLMQSNGQKLHQSKNTFKPRK